MGELAPEASEEVYLPRAKRGFTVFLFPKESEFFHTKGAMYVRIHGSLFFFFPPYSSCTAVSAVISRTDLRNGYFSFIMSNSFPSLTRRDLPSTRKPVPW